MDLITPTRRHNGPRASLREAGAALFISCYELGHQPAGIAYPMGAVGAAGFSPAALDIAVEPFDEERIAQARFIAISVPMHTALRLGSRLIPRIRSINPQAHLCFYGLYASLNASYLLAHGADSVIGGEADVPLTDLMLALEAGRRPDTVSGVGVRDRPAEPYLEKSKAFAAPMRAGLPSLDRYARLIDGRGERIAGYVEASRGCLHECSHCPIVPVYEGRFFIVPEAVVLDDIRSQVERGARHITFGDADFLNGPGHSMRLVRAMHAEFPALTFDFTAKIEHLLKHRTLLPECAEAGCVFVISAVESFNDTVLAHLRKGHTRRDVFEALRLVRQSGLTLRPSLVAFTPWTTLEDYVEMFELVAHHDLIDAIDPVQYTVRLLVPPGSALLDRDPLPHPIGEFVVELDEAGFQHRWRHPDPRMDALHEAVTALVEGAARTHEEPRATFSRLWELACAHAGRPAPGPVPDGGSANPAPRLSEPWFCCAEPTGEQQEAISD